MNPDLQPNAPSSPGLAPDAHFVHGHEVNPLNAALEVVADRPAAGGACTRYRVNLAPVGRPVTPISTLYFQSQPVKSPADFNGLTNEALLSILIDRMQGFQAGPFACRENALALTKLEEAQMWLHKRTFDRQLRGVEGTLAR